MSTNYFVCTYGNFPEREEMFMRSLSEKCYYLHRCARWPSAIGKIQAGDTLLLNVWGCIMAIGIAVGEVEETQDDNWKYRVSVKSWKSYDEKNVRRGFSSYGIQKATLIGGQFALVKKVNSKWAVREINDMGMLSEVGVMQRDCFQLQLGDVASWFYDDLVNGAGVEADIPVLQRGLVWTAQQDELLWDSLMRKIPIGALVLCPAMSAQLRGGACTHHILDGQQRCNAIATGFDDNPFRQKDDETKVSNKRILWCDLGADKMMLKGTSRKYLLRVSTPAHPWGYRITDEAGSGACFETSEIRMARKQLMDEMKTVAYADERRRPHTSEMYPCLERYAKLPIPMGYLTRSYLELEPNSKLESKFWEYVCRYLEDSKTYFPFAMLKIRLLNFIRSNNENDIKLRHQTFDGIKNAMEYVLVAVNAPQEVMQGDTTSDGQDTIEHLFTRINRQGTRLEGEELIYSSIKAYWPVIQKKIDEAAVRRMPSSRMLRLALQVSETERLRNYKVGVSLPEVRQIAEDVGGRALTALDFINKELGALCKTVDYWLDIDKGIGFPCILKTSIANRAPELYALLLLLAKENPELDKQFVVSLVLYLYFFDYRKRISRRVNVVRKIVNDCFQQGFKEDFIIQIVKTCQEYKDNERCLLTPVNLSLPSITDDLEKVQYSIDSLPEGLIWRECFDRFRANRDLLLFAEGTYIKDVFPEYDPARKEMWAEYNRPWDYDHIVPQDVVNSWDEQGANNWWLWCIGNLAAIPLEENRRKNKRPSWEYYDAYKMTYPILQVDEFKRFVEASNQFDLVEFRQQVWKRFLSIYDHVYEAVKVFGAHDVNGSESEAEKKTSVNF